MKKRFLAISQALLLMIVLLLSSCDRGLEIMSVEVIQHPFKTVYIAGVDNSLDMDGCILRKRIRDGRVFEDSFDDLSWATVRHEIDFLMPGEYEVVFYGGSNEIYTMAIQVVLPD